MRSSDSIQSLEMLGVKIDPVSLQQSLDKIETFIRTRSPHLIVTLGTEMVMDAQKHARFRELVNRAALVLPDGGGLIWAAKRLQLPIKEKVAGIDLLLTICAASHEKQWKLFFLGGKPGVAEQAATNIRKKIPDAQIIGTHHGYFEQSEVFHLLQTAKPDILFVGIGSPNQEFWIDDNLGRLGIPVGIGVGGSFDVLAGKLKRAPQWMMRLNLEWLFRFFQEPKRLRRILKIPMFMIRIYAERGNRK